MIDKLSLLILFGVEEACPETHFCQCSILYTTGLNFDTKEIFVIISDDYFEFTV